MLYLSLVYTILSTYFRPGPVFRGMAIATQWIFTGGFSLAYLLSPHFCHRSCHKVHKYKEYHSVCPLVGIGTLPAPLSPPPPRTGGRREGHTRWREMGLGESKFRRLKKKLSTLPTLWVSLYKINLSVLCTSKTLCRKLETNIPRNETVRPRSKFLHCE
jgi:hypothetical protein